MGLLDKATQAMYYEGNDYGNYQFTSLDDIITQFQIAYVGENKIIPKVKRADIAFHAQRAMQELSFDTFKSIKAYQIELPPSLQMILPIDYVNYTKISSVDSSGIKHPLYPTRHTSNPFQVKQEDDKGYYFSTDENLVINSTFDAAIPLTANWGKYGPETSHAWSSTKGANDQWPLNIDDIILQNSDELKFKHLWINSGSNVASHAYCVWQKIDVRDLQVIDFSAYGNSAGAQSNINAAGVVRVGLTSVDPTTGLKPDGSIGWENQGLKGGAVNASRTSSLNPNYSTPNNQTNSMEITYSEWTDATSGVKDITDVDVDEYDYIWVIIQSYIPFATTAITDYDTWDHDGDDVGGINYMDSSHAAYSFTSATDNSSLGDEQITDVENRDFSSSSDWSALNISGGSLTEPSNRLQVVTSTDDEVEGTKLASSKLTTPIIGETYRIAAKLDNTSGATTPTIQFSYAGADAVNVTATSGTGPSDGTINTTEQEYYADIVAVNTTGNLIIQNAASTSSTTFTIDDVLVKRLGFGMKKGPTKKSTDEQSTHGSYSGQIFTHGTDYDGGTLFDTTSPGFGPTSATNTSHIINSVSNIIIKSSISLELLVSENEDTNSSTWNNYKSTTSSENNTDDYTDSTYWPAGGERFGLEPSHAQINGSFFIDSQRGKIHFSSNISGKTVILDYISDSLGTDDEMQVHKFAEEAMYKWIAYGILSARANTPEYIINRFKRERFAETRKAKLRLSNIKLEEITQILRGKSKQIKH